MTKSRRVVLAEETLRVAAAVLPFGRVADELWAAHTARGGTLALGEIPEVLRLLSAGLGYRGRVVTEQALQQAIDQFRIAVANVDYTASSVEVSVWDVLRDGVPSRYCRVASARPPDVAPPTH